MIEFLLKHITPEALEKYLTGFISAILTGYGYYKIKSKAWATAADMNKVGPVAPKAIPEATLGKTTLSPSSPRPRSDPTDIGKRVAEIERRDRERNETAEHAQQQRRIWNLEEDVRVLEKKLRESREEANASAQELIRARFEIELKEQKIYRLLARIDNYEERPRFPYDPDKTPVSSSDLDLKKRR